MDLNKIKEYAKGYEKDMTAFLRAIVKNPGESCDENSKVLLFSTEGDTDPDRYKSIVWDGNER